MRYEVKTVVVDNGGKVKTEYELYFLGLLIGTSKLHCDATLVGKQLDNLFEQEYVNRRDDALRLSDEVAKATSGMFRRGRDDSQSA